MIQLPNIRNFTRNIRGLKKWLPISIVIVAVLATLGLAGWTVKKALQFKSDSSDPRAIVSGAKASNEVNKDFGFPVNDSSGKEITRLKFKLQNAELRDEIIVNGKRATSVKGRTFLILTLKITNDSDNSLQIHVSDYFRLTVNGQNGEFMAPEIHSDPVLVQSISTKSTRVGFPINDTDKDKVLWVGEIKGEKQRVDLSI
jgi:hypothetical protein